MDEKIEKLPRQIVSGDWKAGHVQGIAADVKNGYIYYSFTTLLVKTDLAGNLIGWADGIVGHLGCMDFCEADGRVYASLEYKNDAIGSSILKMLDSDTKIRNGFYIAVFDGAKITRPGMHAERDGIMTAVFLPEVLEDYAATVTLNGRRIAHRHGCSGIDGLAFGPEYGTRGGKYYLNVTYGVYGDLERDDNDMQVILQYDISDWPQYERPLTQAEMHRCGPAKPRGKYFVYTGNTVYGVQNYEYDEFTGNWIMAVYRGQKPQFPNYAIFVVDGSASPAEGTVKSGDERIPAKLLTLSRQGLHDEASGIYGYEFESGQTGLYSLGGGYFYISRAAAAPDGRQNSTVNLYRWTGDVPCPFEIVK